MSAGLRDAVEALAVRTRERAVPRRTDNTPVQRAIGDHLRAVSDELHALLAAHPTPDQQPTADRMLTEGAADRLCFTRHGRASACHVCTGHVREVAAALGGESA